MNSVEEISWYCERTNQHMGPVSQDQIRSTVVGGIFVDALDLDRLPAQLLGDLAATPRQGSPRQRPSQR